MPVRAHVVQPGTKVRLAEISTDEDDGLSKKEGEGKLEALLAELQELQELLFASSTHSLLVVLQGMDTSGKEGAIRRIARGTNLHGTRVAAFKQPTPEELAHDFLWRIHKQTPAKGELGIFNRSHYEDVLVVRVHELVPKEVWSERYGMIRDFEKLLVENNTILLKFMLHISFEEQRQRLLQREEDDLKSWKLNLTDWKERDKWEDYMDAYQDALEETSVDGALWNVVSADKKWYRDLCIVEKLVEVLRPYREAWVAQLATLGIERRQEIQAFRAQRGL